MKGRVSLGADSRPSTGFADGALEGASAALLPGLGSAAGKPMPLDDRFVDPGVDAVAQNPTALCLQAYMHMAHGVARMRWHGIQRSLPTRIHA